MEIIERGNIPQETPRKIICRYCDSLLAYLKNDIKYGEETRDSPYITCPVCGKNISTYNTIKD